ncbi:MAG: hypothetical protein EOO14_01360 [Chitinophagaceae bacterium]|nr:MAG: hypothetical protein EOO14_01360 [Chitinophagaceae bacterium]
MKRSDNSKFFIQEHLLREGLFHGGIGNKQIEEILLRNGYQPISFPFTYDFSWKAKLSRAVFLSKLLFVLPAKASIVFQWPLHARIHVWLVKLLKLLRPSIQLICFLTDINGLKDNDLHTLQNERKLFGQLKWFIVHNNAMETWLLQQQPFAKVALLGFFDYTAAPNSSDRSKSKGVAFAGYLGKSLFIKDLDKLPGITFLLYGSTETFLLHRSHNVHYKGVQSPEDLPGVIEGAFGLLWDGDSIDGLEGVFGNYNRFISPHKLSLYILAGLPVIAHSDAGAASLVRNFNIGFTVNALTELEATIEAISDEEYQEMRRNCLQLAAVISKGRCLLNALAKLEFMRSSGQPAQNGAG